MSEHQETLSSTSASDLTPSAGATYGWGQELQDLLRGSAGSFLFGIPLLYTVEVWSIGSSASGPMLLAILGVTFVMVWLLTQTEGFRRTLSLRPAEALMESVEALSLGMVCAAIALIILRRINLDTPFTETLGKLVFEGVPFSLGVALARSTLSQPRQRDRRHVNSSRRFAAPDLFNLQDTLIDLDATLIGAIIIAFSIAPTEEVRLLSASLPPLWLLIVMAASLFSSYIIVFASGFGDRTERQQRGLLLSPVTETLMAYIVALAASVMMLIFFQQLSPSDPWQEWVGDAIVLTFPATIGGAAGRILI